MAHLDITFMDSISYSNFVGESEINQTSENLQSVQNYATIMRTSYANVQNHLSTLFV